MIGWRMNKNGLIVLETRSASPAALSYLFEQVGDWLAGEYGQIDKDPNNSIEFHRGFRSPHWTTSPTINVSSGRISFSDLGGSVEIRYDLKMPEGWLALFLLSPIIFMIFGMGILFNEHVSIFERIVGGILFPATPLAMGWWYMKFGHRRFVKHLEHICAKALAANN